MIDAETDQYYLDASAFFARHPHLDKQDPRFEYACDRRDYVEALAAPAVEVAQLAPSTPSSPAVLPQTAAERAWDRAITAHNAKGQPPPAEPFSSPQAAAVWGPLIERHNARVRHPTAQASDARKAAPPGAGTSGEPTHPAWRWAMRRHGSAVR